MVGIDTLSLELGKCEIKDGAGLTIRPADIDMKTGAILESPLFETDKGRTITGARAFANTDFFQFDIAPIYGKVHAYVKLSVPKFHQNNGLNFEVVSDADTLEVLRKLEGSLDDLGIRTDIFKSRVNRVDTFSNILTDNEFEDYAGVLGCLRARRMKKLNYGAGTFLWHNTQSELTCYDKEKEMFFKIKHDKLPMRLRELIPAKCVRFEHRIKKGRKLESSCDFRNTEEFKRDGLRRVKENYMTQFSDVFKVDSKDLITGWLKHEMRKDMEMFRDHHGRNWFSKFLKYRGLAMLVQMASIESLRSCLLEVTGDRKKAFRFEKEMERVLAYKPEGDSIDWHNINELYIELKTKLLKQEV